jgi:protein-S-isoprenylcysteine O-methyltransferase Ste14
MTIFGAGHKILALAIPYLGIVTFLDIYFAPLFKFPGGAASFMTVTGLVLLGIGSVLQVYCAVRLFIAFGKNHLVTDGIYRLMMHPMYFIPALLLLPGFALMMNSWLIPTSSLALFISTKLFIREEEEMLEAVFGDTYRKYKESVLLKFI